MKKTQKKKPPFLFYVIMIAFPLLFFILLETGLNIFDYGKNLDAFITISEEYDDLLFINPDIPFRYAINNSSPPAVAFDAYKKIKTDSTFRIFVMGGSSTAGFPYAYNITFPKYLQRKLNLLYPDMNIEVINLGITAHNSYTIADLADEVLEQGPDLILIYAGHNEYYGVLGVGSSVAYGNSRFVTKLMIFLNRTKTYQLINYLVKWGAGLLSEKEKPEFTDETLMARVIGESQILYNSEIYQSGIRQFRDNLNEFLHKINEAGINVIIGQLAFNYLQKPFISVSADENKNADSLFALGLTDYNAGQYNKAKQYLLEAKEHDVLRFRAPQAMNDVIKELAAQYNLLQVNIDSIFNANSPGDITGYNLMVDHLHPNIEGYNLIGDIFFDKMKQNNFLPDPVEPNITERDADSLLLAGLPYTKLDSTLSHFRITKLLKSYPFVSREESQRRKITYRLNNYIDTLALQVLSNKILWRVAHQRAADWYYSKKDYDNFMNEINAIINYQPYTEITYATATGKLINAKRYDDALYYLKQLHKLHPNDYTYKWLGSIALQKNNYEEAIKYLNKSLEYNPKDSQTWYNLSGSYYNSGQLEKAIYAVKQCLNIDGNNVTAKNFYNSLLMIRNQK